MRKLTSFFVLLTFVISCIMPPQGFAQSLTAIGLMSEPGTAVTLTSGYTPAYLKGMVINPSDPFKFDFIIHRGDEPLVDEARQAEYSKLIKYFLASLAVPDTEQWVNLSPYEQDRIIPDGFGLTEMGRDLLAQDYMLKQLSSSLTDPDTALGKKFWEGVYAQAYQTFGTTDIPTDTFNKVWITPDKAVVYEKGNTVYVLEHHLKVMMEKDYLATKQNQAETTTTEENEATLISYRVMKEVIVPAIEKEVNEGKNFAPVRQVYSGMLLASWYKLALKESILGQIYADRGKVKGVDQDPRTNQEIYSQYVEAFKKGVFNMIKEDIDLYTQEIIPRKYFSGGLKKDYLNSDGSQNTEVFKRTTNDAAAESRIRNEASTDDLANVVVRQYDAKDRAQANVVPREEKVQAAIRKLSLPESDRQEVVDGLKVYDREYQAIETEAKGLPQFSARYKALVRSNMERFRRLFAQKYRLNPVNVAFVLTGSMGKGTVRPNSGDIDFDIVIFDSLTREELGISPEVWSTMSREDVERVTRERVARINTDSQDFLDLMSSFFGKTVSNEVAMKMKTGDGLENVMLDSQFYEILGKSMNAQEDAADEGQVFKRLFWKEIIGAAPELNIAIDGIMTSQRNEGPMLAQIQRDLRSKSDLAKMDSRIDSRYYRIKEGLALYETLMEYLMVKDKEKRLLTNRKAGDAEDFGTVPYVLRATADQLVSLGVITSPSEFIQGYENLSNQIRETSDQEFSLAKSPDVQNLITIIDRLGQVEGKSLIERPVKDAAMLTPAQGKELLQALFQNNDAALRELEVAETVDELVAFAKGKKESVGEEVSLVLDRVATKLQQSQSQVSSGVLAGQKDAAQDVLDRAKDTKGGIDFNAAALDMQIKRDGAGVPLPISQQDLEGIRIDGLVPVILNIQPAANVPLFT